MTDCKLQELSAEIQKLKTQHIDLVQSNCALKSQIKSQDAEIQELNTLLNLNCTTMPCPYLAPKCSQPYCKDNLTSICDRPKPMEPVCERKMPKPCGSGFGTVPCERKVPKCRRTCIMPPPCSWEPDELCQADCLEYKYKDALSQLQDAMKRAWHLAERNKKLEQELKDIDQMALAVEAECNNTTKSYAERYQKVQERLQEAYCHIKCLETDNQKLKCTCEQLRMEKCYAEKLVDSLTEKINNYAIVEQNLNLEIDRLCQVTACQNKKICMLECQMQNGGIKKDAETSDPSIKKRDSIKKDKNGKKNGAKKKKGKK